MRNKMLIIAAAVMMMFGLTACGSEASYEKLDLDDYIKVGKYKGLEVDGFTIKVTEDEVQAQIDSELEASAAPQELDKGTVLKDGDTVNIDYVGKKDGKKFDGGSAEGYDLELGSDSFIDGFEDGLVGSKVGDKVKLELTFPEDYGEADLAGEDVSFAVTINSATRNVVPDYDLDFVQNTTDFKTLKEYEASVEKQIYNTKENEAISNQQTELWSQVMENTEVIEYPEKIVDYFIKFNSDQMDVMAETYGMTREELLATYDFGDEGEFAAVNEDSSRFQVKQEMVIEYIAAKEGLDYSNKEAEELLAYYESMGYDEATIKAQTGRPMEEYIRMVLLQQKVLEFLLDNALIK
ncbi:MAG: trigger factor [Bacillota bacterium]|nr:trigger factor [Bacillota bacterium]